MKKVGRPKNFDSPEQLWEAFQSYSAWVDKTPLKKQDYVGKDGDMVYRELQRPMTMEGFKNYIWEEYGNADHYFKNSEGAYEEFRQVCSRIKDSIRQNQIEGGMVGIYNPSITQRLNGLVEKQETKHDGGIQITIKDA